MMPISIESQASVPPSAYHSAQARLDPALHIDALTLVTTLHLLTLCRLAVRLAHRRCPPPLPAGPGGAPLTYSEESLLLIALWRLSYQDMRDWLPSPLQEGTVLAIPVVSVPRTKRIGWLLLFIPGIVLLVVAAAMAAQWIH